MGDSDFFYARSGFAPYADGSGFKITVTVKKETEGSEPTISVDEIYKISAAEWIAAARKIERMLDLVTPDAVGGSSDPQ